MGRNTNCERLCSFGRSFISEGMQPVARSFNKRYGCTGFDQVDQIKKQVRHVARMEDVRNRYEVLVGNLKGREG
jgi:hypothetical protein